MLSGALAIPMVGKHFLHFLPGGIIYESFVFAIILNTSIGDDAFVVRVSKHGIDHPVVNGLRGLSCGLTAGKPPLSQVLSQ
ncbi:MAG: hypothetical protein FWD27_04665 [Coriobacteriia bacterium]|nr:hypothetical protein [Coriobacteriia bacterium]